MKFKIDQEKITDDLLTDLIGKCEDKMSSPFKEKVKAKVVVASPEMEEESDSSEEEQESPLDEMSKEDLIKLYEKLKDDE